MRTIYKYPIKPGVNTIGIPDHAKPLSVGVQDEKPFIWFEVETENKNVLKEIHVYGTGHEISPCIWLEFIGRYTLSNGTEWHVFKTGS